MEITKYPKVVKALTGWRAFPRSRKELVASIRLLTSLRTAGWHDSLLDQFRFDPDTAMPLLTYGAIGFMDAYLTDSSTVLEFGSGGSTIWLAARVKHLVSIEDDKRWAELIPRFENTQLQLVTCGGDWYDDSPDFSYSRAVSDKASAFPRVYDAIIVDGKARTDCAREAINLLSNHGFIVLDDLHDPLVTPAFQLLSTSGLKCIEFWGIRPGSGEFGGTAVFLNANNVLDSHGKLLNP